MVPEKGFFVGGRGKLARGVKALFALIITLLIMVLFTLAVMGIVSMTGRVLSPPEVYLRVTSYVFHVLIVVSLLSWVFTPPKGKKSGGEK